MAGVNQWICIALGVVSASVLVWATFHLNAKYGEWGLMKMQAARNHPRYIINRRRFLRLIISNYWCPVKRFIPGSFLHSGPEMVPRWSRKFRLWRCGNLPLRMCLPGQRAWQTHQALTYTHITSIPPTARSASVLQAKPSCSVAYYSEFNEHPIA